MEKYCKMGNENAVHMILLLKAERLATTQTRQKHKQVDVHVVKNSFDKAIRTFGREGILSFKALANERAGAYYLVLGDSNWAATYLTRAHDLYLDWGAGGKARQMEGKYGANLIQSSNRIPQMTSGIRSRERVTVKHVRSSETQRLEMESATITTISRQSHSTSS